MHFGRIGTEKIAFTVTGVVVAVCDNDIIIIAWIG